MELSGFTLVAMETQLPQQQGMRLMPIVSGNLAVKYELNMT